MVAPVIFTFGNDEQKEQFLPRILSGEDWWCQGYSEPGAGSDLAACAPRAVREGDHYIVNGQKTWTTLAQYADWIFCLVRTDHEREAAGRHLVPADRHEDAGHHREADHRARRRARGERGFFDNVRCRSRTASAKRTRAGPTPSSCSCNERSGIAGVARSKRAIERLKEIAAPKLIDGEPLIETDEFARKIAELEIDLTALEFTELRTLAPEAKGQMAGPGKLDPQDARHRDPAAHHRADDGGRRLLRLPERARCSATTSSSDRTTRSARRGRYFNMRKTSIYGGSNEIQRNIIAKMVLGL